MSIRLAKSGSAIRRYSPRKRGLNTTWTRVSRAAAGGVSAAGAVASGEDVIASVATGENAVDAVFANVVTVIGAIVLIATARVRIAVRANTVSANGPEQTKKGSEH